MKNLIGDDIGVGEAGGGGVEAGHEPGRSQWGHGGEKSVEEGSFDAGAEAGPFAAEKGSENGLLEKLRGDDVCDGDGDFGGLVGVEAA